MNGIDTCWTTKDGRKIPICNMEDSHVVNTIKMLLRARGVPLSYIERHTIKELRDELRDIVESEEIALENVIDECRYQ